MSYVYCISQYVARDVVNSVRSNVANVMKAVQELRQSRDSDAGSDNETVNVKRSEWDHRQRELDIRQRELDNRQRELDILRSELDHRNRGFDIVWSGITKINALTSDTAGIIDPAGQNGHSKISKVTNKSNDIISCLHSIYISMHLYKYITFLRT